MLKKKSRNKFLTRKYLILSNFALIHWFQISLFQVYRLATGSADGIRIWEYYMDTSGGNGLTVSQLL